jgi:hypothetical protein
MVMVMVCKRQATGDRPPAGVGLWTLRWACHRRQADGIIVDGQFTVDGQAERVLHRRERHVEVLWREA